MKTILILAGRSKRFWPLTEKPFFPLCGKTLLEHQVNRLRAGGCRDILLVCGEHNHQETQKLFPRLKIVRQKDTNGGMRAAVLSALYVTKNEPILVVSANDIIEPSAYDALLRASYRKSTDGVLLACRVREYFPGGYLTMRGRRAVSIVEKPGRGREPSNLVNIVAHVHSDPEALLHVLKKVNTRSDDSYEHAMTALMAEKHYHVLPYKGVWHTVKYPWHLLPLLGYLLPKITEGDAKHHATSIHRTAVIEGTVLLGKGVRVLPHATIVGPCTIGKGSVIGTGALIRESSIGENCIIGFGTEVKASVLGNDIWTHMTYIGDSIVASNVAFGGGCLTGNFRLDEGIISSTVNGMEVSTDLMKFGIVIGEGCRLGIGVRINPGVKIGTGSFIGAGITLSEDIPDRSFVLMKNGKMEIRKNRLPILPPTKRLTYQSLMKK